MYKFFPLEIRGLGTPEVESLPSYLHRLANAHQVTVATLLKRIINWYQPKHPSRHIALSKIGSTGELSVFVRPNQGTQDLVMMLSEALGNYDLSGTTFLCLYNAIARTPGLFSQNIRWCPICMHKSETTHDTGYFKLLWSINSITHCPEHHSKLIERCPICNKTQGGYGYKKDPCKCQKCGAPLSQYNLNELDFKPTWDKSGSDMLQLVDYISNNPRSVFQENSVKDLITREFDKAWYSNTEDEFWKIIPKNECIGITEGEMPITLKRARVIAYRFGVNLSDLLLGDLSTSTFQLDGKWSSKLPRDIRPIKKRDNPSSEVVLQNVHSLMKENKNTPRPLVYYARSAGVTTGYLNYRLPILSERILTVHNIWRKQEKDRKQREAHNEALKLFTRFEGDPASFSKKGALRKIRAETNLPKEVVRKAINEVHQIVYGGTEK